MQRPQPVRRNRDYSQANPQWRKQSNVALSFAPSFLSCHPSAAVVFYAATMASRTNAVFWAGGGSRYNELAGPAYASPERRRVVVTGIGVVTPFGHDVENFWQALLAGQSCIAPITRLDTSDFPIHFGGQVADVTTTPFLPATLIRRNDLSTNIGLLAGGLALESAGLGALAEHRPPISVMVGSAFGAMQGLQDGLRRFYMRGWRKMHPLSVPPQHVQFPCRATCRSSSNWGQSPHSGGGVRVGRGGHRRGISAHIATGEDAVVLAGGADAPICGSVLAGWTQLRVLSQHSEPAQASRPFEQDRDGLVMSEGAGMLVLEELEHARNAERAVGARSSATAPAATPAT